MIKCPYFVEPKTLISQILDSNIIDGIEIGEHEWTSSFTQYSIFFIVFLTYIRMSSTPHAPTPPPPQQIIEVCHHAPYNYLFNRNGPTSWEPLNHHGTWPEQASSTPFPDRISPLPCTFYNTPTPNTPPGIPSLPHLSGMDRGQIPFRFS